MTGLNSPPRPERCRRAASAGETGQAQLPALPLLLLAALVGGLLLNVMPCVFPILSLKALSLARAGESEAQARAEGLAYTAGVVLACLALGGLLLGLRAAGGEVGWAFQLQEPGIVALLLVLAAAITANLLGLFEFAVPGFASEGSPQGAFATGLLAAFVATPCTGPFMAAAMGAALMLAACARRWRCSRRSGWGWRCRSSPSPSSPRCAAGCPGRGRGWCGFGAGWRCRWGSPRSRCCGWRAGSADGHSRWPAPGWCCWRWSRWAGLAVASAPA